MSLFSLSSSFDKNTIEKLEKIINIYENENDDNIYKAIDKLILNYKNTNSNYGLCRTKTIINWENINIVDNMIINDAFSLKLLYFMYYNTSVDFFKKTTALCTYNNKFNKPGNENNYGGSIIALQIYSNDEKNCSKNLIEFIFSLLIKRYTILPKEILKYNEEMNEIVAISFGSDTNKNANIFATPLKIWFKSKVQKDIIEKYKDVIVNNIEKCLNPKYINNLDFNYKIIFNRYNNYRGNNNRRGGNYRGRGNNNYRDNRYKKKYY